ncbi:MAG: ATP-binding protein [Bacteroidia bacterium]
MNFLNTRKYSAKAQIFICVSLTILISVLCFVSASLLGYRVVALLLLFSVSILAVLFEIIPVLISALLSALIWNYFFIPPLFTFHIHSTEDMLMFLSYFFIALVNAVLTFKIRKEEKKNRDKEEKENSIRLYNTLLNSLSHELRTPLSTIVGAMDTLKENQAQLSKTNKDELLNQIDEASMQLNRQVENLLNMSRLESGMLRLNLDWCDTNELIYTVIQPFATNQSHRILFVPDEQLPLFKYDRGLMEQVLQNLLLNAIKHTPSGTQIKISATLEADCCTIRIADNGTGIPEEEMKHVFEKFHRIPQSKTGGIGLGLSIVKGFVEAHQGRIRLEKNEEKGVTFSISIPAEVSYLNLLKHE